MDGNSGAFFFIPDGWAQLDTLSLAKGMHERTASVYCFCFLFFSPWPQNTVGSTYGFESSNSQLLTRLIIAPNAVLALSMALCWLWVCFPMLLQCCWDCLFKQGFVLVLGCFFNAVGNRSCNRGLEWHFLSSQTWLLTSVRCH